MPTVNSRDQRYLVGNAHPTIQIFCNVRIKLADYCLIVAKNRNGPTGFVDLYFHHYCMRFEDMMDPD